jgi:pilus assembly protein Flp/PilA
MGAGRAVLEWVGLVASGLTVAFAVGLGTWSFVSKARAVRLAKHVARHPAHDDPTLLQTVDTADGPRTPWFPARRADREDAGSSAVEYGLLIAAVAAVLAGLVFGLGALIKQSFDKACTELSEQVHPGCVVPGAGTGSTGGSGGGDTGTGSDSSDTGSGDDGTAPGTAPDTIPGG